jgi:phage baseplate assembly protein W
MLVITAEALAGQSKIVGKCQTCGTEYSYGGTNRKELEAVLGTGAYTRLYRSDNGSLRHRLLHGSPIDENAASEVSALAYNAILEFLVKRLGLTSIEFRVVWRVPKVHNRCRSRSSRARARLATLWPAHRTSTLLLSVVYRLPVQRQ